MANMANNATPAKRTPAKAPAKKTAPAPTTAPLEGSTDEVTPGQDAPTEDTTAVPQRPTIEIRGRLIPVARPRDEQLIIWNRTVRRLRALTDDSPKEEVDLLTDRALRVIQSAMAAPADREWLEDEMLDRGMTLLEATTIIAKATNQGALAPTAPTTGPRARPRR